MVGFFLFVVVGGERLFAFIVRTRRGRFRRCPELFLTRVQTLADGMPEASIAGQKGGFSKTSHRRGTREGDNRFSAISAMLTWAKEHGRLTVIPLRKLSAGR
jgi:hypothetical protein